MTLVNIDTMYYVTKHGLYSSRSFTMDRQYCFATAFDSASKTVDYNSAWANGTGYLDFAVLGESAPVLIPGETARSVCDKGRRIVIVGTRLGNVVMFERDVPCDGVRSARIVCNTPRDLSYMFNTNMSADDVSRVSNIATNVGLWLEGIHTTFCY